jgi:hypothetical protein
LLTFRLVAAGPQEHVSGVRDVSFNLCPGHGIAHHRFMAKVHKKAGQAALIAA